MSIQNGLRAVKANRDSNLFADWFSGSRFFSFVLESDIEGPLSGIKRASHDFQTMQKLFNCAQVSPFAKTPFVKSFSPSSQFDWLPVHPAARRDFIVLSRIILSCLIIETKQNRRRKEEREKEMNDPRKKVHAEFDHQRTEEEKQTIIHRQFIHFARTRCWLDGHNEQSDYLSRMMHDLPERKFSPD